MARLSRDFYNGDTVSLAQALLGLYLVRVRGGEPLVCRITETEAYVGRCDKACHAYGYRRTKRNAVLFGEPGHAYIYFIYGMYYCLNLVTEPAGEPSAVLLRGLEAVSGRDTICRARFGKTETELTAGQRKNLLNGPGKICRGLYLSTEHNGLDLTGDELYVCTAPADAGVAAPPVFLPAAVHSGPRIGVDYAEEARDFPWRFWLDEEAKDVSI